MKMFSYHKETTAGYDVAEKKCANERKTLARVKDIATWNRLIEYKDGEVEYGYWWLGAEKEGASSEYFWSDGTAYKQLDPIMKILRDGIGRRCLALYTHTPLNKMKLFSLPCDRHLYYICQSQLQSTTLETTLLPSTTSQGTPVAHYMGGNFTEYTTPAKTSDILTTYQKGTTMNHTLSSAYQEEMELVGEQMIWMFVSIILGLLLVMSLVVIVKLSIDLKRLKICNNSPHLDGETQALNISPV